MSVVPDVLTALHTAWSRAGITNLQVDYGNVYDTQRKMSLAVGFNTQGPAVTSTLAIDDQAAADDLEVFDIVSHLFYWSGAKNVQQIDAALFAAFKSLKAALDADPTLGGACKDGMARIIAHELTHSLTEPGADASLAIIVRCSTNGEL